MFLGQEEGCECVCNFLLVKQKPFKTKKRTRVHRVREYHVCESSSRMTLSLRVGLVRVRMCVYMCVCVGTCV